MEKIISVGEWKKNFVEQLTKNCEAYENQIDARDEKISDLKDEIDRLNETIDELQEDIRNSKITAAEYRAESALEVR